MNREEAVRIAIDYVARSPHQGLVPANGFDIPNYWSVPFTDPHRDEKTPDPALWLTVDKRTGEVMEFTP